MTDFERSASPSDTVTSASYVPGAVYVCDGSSAVESSVPLPSKSQL